MRGGGPPDREHLSALTRTLLTAAMFAGALIAGLLLFTSPAAADVGPDGAYRTAVSFDVPTFHGLEPRLGLAYSSNGANGWIGRGWSLTGLSTIRRESARGGLPHWDPTDRFTLDGTPLLPCPEQPPAFQNWGVGCSHPAPGLVTYAPQVENYQRIAADPTSGHWYVWRTDGVRATYDPGLRTPAGSLEWRLTALADTSGNSVAFDWTAETAEQVSTLDRIRYGDVELIFHNESRPDPLTRLAAVDELAGGRRVRAYALRYAAGDGQDAPSVLESLQRCGSDAAVANAVVAGPSALPATTFSTPVGNDSAPWTGQAQVGSADWAANWPAGPDDSARFSATLNGGLAGQVGWPMLPRGPSRWVSVDLNGDRRRDFVLITPTNDRTIEVSAEFTLADGGYRLMRKAIAWPEGGLHQYTTVTALVGDVNGDGVDDLILGTDDYGSQSQVLARRIRTISGSSAYPSGALQVGAAQPLPARRSQFLLGDVTGDGRADLVEYGPGSLLRPPGQCPWQLRTAHGTSAGTFTFDDSRADCWPISSVPAESNFQLADVNGDLRMDVVSFRAAGQLGDTARILTGIAGSDGRFDTHETDTGLTWAPASRGGKQKRLGGVRTCETMVNTEVPNFVRVVSQ